MLDCLSIVLQYGHVTMTRLTIGILKGNKHICRLVTFTLLAMSARIDPICNLKAIHAI